MLQSFASAWRWFSENWATLSGIAATVAAITMFFHKKVFERRMWKMIDSLRTIQASNPALLAFEPRTARERKLYEAMVEKGVLFRGHLPDHYQVRER